jgi:hypothetical protein
MEWLYCCFKRAQEIVEKMEKEIQDIYHPKSFDMERNVNPMHQNSTLTDIIIG